MTDILKVSGFAIEDSNHFTAGNDVNIIYTKLASIIEKLDNDEINQHIKTYMKFVTAIYV